MRLLSCGKGCESGRRRVASPLKVRPRVRRAPAGRPCEGEDGIPGCAGILHMPAVPLQRFSRPRRPAPTTRRPQTAPRRSPAAPCRNPAESFCKRAEPPRGGSAVPPDCEPLPRARRTVPHGRKTVLHARKPPLHPAKQFRNAAEPRCTPAALSRSRIFQGNPAISPCCPQVNIYIRPGSGSGAR